VPRSVKLSEAPSFGKPAVIYDPGNRGSKSYQEIAKEFLSRFGAGASKKTTAENLKDKETEPAISKLEEIL